MRTGLIELASALVLVSTMAAGGCGGGGGGSTGVAGSAGGSAGGAGSTGTAGSMGGTTGTGGSGVSVTTISGSRTLGSLTTAESDQLCNDTKAYFMSTISKANSCKFSALSNAASTSAPNDNVLRTNCTSMETSCNASATMGPGTNTACFPPPATCNATVEQYSACIADGTALLNQAATTLPSCSAVRLADITPIFAAVESLYMPPGCMTLMTDCPSFVFPIPN
jgi:hypothetical protein